MIKTDTVNIVWRKANGVSMTYETIPTSSLPKDLVMIVMITVFGVILIQYAFLLVILLIAVIAGVGLVLKSQNDIRFATAATSHQLNQALQTALPLTVEEVKKAPKQSLDDGLFAPLVSILPAIAVGFLDVRLSAVASVIFYFFLRITMERGYWEKLPTFLSEPYTDFQSWFFRDCSLSDSDIEELIVLIGTVNNR